MAEGKAPIGTMGASVFHALCLRPDGPLSAKSSQPAWVTGPAGFWCDTAIHRATSVGRPRVEFGPPRRVESKWAYTPPPRGRHAAVAERSPHPPAPRELPQSVCQPDPARDHVLPSRRGRPPAAGTRRDPYAKTQRPRRAVPIAQASAVARRNPTPAPPTAFTVRIWSGQARPRRECAIGLCVSAALWPFFRWDGRMCLDVLGMGCSGYRYG